MLTAGIDFVSDKKSIGIAVSGGADSVSLLVSLSHLSKEFNVPLRVISINHNLREEKESFSDVKYVEFLCNEIIKTGIDLKFFAVNFPRGKILEIAKERNKGVEEAARFLRYKAFDEFFMNENVSCVCLAHNLNDNIETVLMRFLQGSSFEGLSGIKFVREKFVRPLLNISRLDIENYLKLQNIKCPLIVELGQVAVRLNYILKVIAEQSLRGRTDDKTLAELIVTADGNDSALGSKALNVILLLLKQALGNKHRHIYVLVTKLLEAAVKLSLYILPDSVAVGADDHASLNARIIDQLCFFYNVGIPLSKIHVHARDLFNHFFLCHNFSTPIDIIMIKCAYIEA